MPSLLAADVDHDVIRAWWSLRSLTAIRWLVEHGFDPSSPGCEIDVSRTPRRPYKPPVTENSCGRRI
jgi:hypothetical protein